MNRLFLIAFLTLIAGASNAHAGYYYRVPNSSNGHYEPSPDRNPGDFQQEQVQNGTAQQQMQNEMYRQRAKDQMDRDGVIWPGMEGFNVR
jgi:hypothetical protein